MKRSRGIGVLLTLGLVVGCVATASAVVLLVVIPMLSLFAAVGLSFTYYADVHVVPVPDEAGVCNVVISILDEHGQALETREERIPAGEKVSLQHRSRAGPGETDVIRATVKSRTVPPLPPGPCPVLASLQVVDASSGKTEALMLPAVQRVVREVIPAP